MDVNRPVLFAKNRLSRARNTARLGGDVARYWGHYFSHRRFPKHQEFYVVYTNLDHSIPFEPCSAIDYWLINLKLLPTALKLGSSLPGERLEAIRHAYLDIVTEGCAAFMEAPTIMPRFAHHNEYALRAVHTLLRPINCSPSLHTAVPFFVYNLAVKYFPGREAELRRNVGKVVSVIIGAKLHAIVDVAFGIFLCQRIVRDKLGLDFDDLETFFTQEQEAGNIIGYEHVYRIYHEIEELAKTQAGEDAELPEIMKRYFEEIGLPRVRRGQSNCLYDLERKTLVAAPGLVVGRGLL